MKQFNENATENTVQLIKAETIMPNRSQPRTEFEPESLAMLAESIKKYGIIQPLTVRQNPEKSDFSSFQYELIAGERRLRAAKLAGISEVPCIIIPSDTKKSAELAIIENLHRNDLNIFEEASAIASLISMHKLTQEQIATQLSLTQASVANKLRLLKLTDQEKKMITENKLTERHARALLRIKDKDQRQNALLHIISSSLNVKQAEDYVEKQIAPTEKAAQKPYSYKDMLLYLSKAVKTTREKGYFVRTTQTETDTDVIYTIRIPKETQIEPAQA